MKACIVGHGPSMLRNQYGTDIDSHDVVVRLKRSQHLLQDSPHYGSKTTIVCGSAVVGHGITGPWSKKYWLFLDTRTLQMSPQELSKLYAGFIPHGSCLIDAELCSQWIHRYREIRESVDFDPRQVKKATDVGGGVRPLSDDLGHMHPSAGMFSICYAMKHLKPGELTLYGFDNVRTGTFDWSVTRGADWKEYPDHNWKTESNLLHEVAREYGYTINHDAEVIRCSAAM